MLSNGSRVGPGYVVDSCASWYESAKRLNDGGRRAKTFKGIIGRFLSTTDRLYRPERIPEVGKKLLDVWHRILPRLEEGTR